jgi:hypothetical protein
VEDQHVDLVDAELARTLLEAVQGLGVSVIADPNLGLKEDFRPLEARAPDRLADLPLVAVGRCRVDVPVAGCERRVDCGPGLLRWCLEAPSPSAGISTPLFRVMKSMTRP